MRKRAALPWLAAGATAVVVALVAGALMLLLSGEPVVSTQTDDLVRRVAAHGDVSGGLVAVDLVAVRESLDLPEDADPGEGFGTEDEAKRRLLGTSIVTPFLHDPAAHDLREAVDLGQVEAAARTLHDRGERSLLVIATGQPTDEIAARLEAAGWSRRGTLLSHPTAGSDDHRWPRVALDGGLLALGNDPDVVRRAVTGTPDNSPLATRAADLLRSTESYGIVLRDLPGEGCVARWAVVDRYDGSGEVLLVAAGDVDDIELDLDRRRLRRWDEIRAELDSDRVWVRLDAGQFGVTPLQLAQEGLDASGIWTCRGPGS